MHNSLCGDDGDGIMVVNDNEQYRVYCEACALCRALCIAKQVSSRPHKKMSWAYTPLIVWCNDFCQSTEFTAAGRLLGGGASAAFMYTPLPKTRVHKQHIHSQESKHILATYKHYIGSSLAVTALARCAFNIISTAGGCGRSHSLTTVVLFFFCSVFCARYSV